MFGIPSQTSDAGPLQQPETPMDWRERLETAEEYSRLARRSYNDSVATERAARRSLIEEAVAELLQALEILP